MGSTQGQVAIYDASLNFQTGGTLTNGEQILQLAFVIELRARQAKNPPDHTK